MSCNTSISGDRLKTLASDATSMTSSMLLASEISSIIEHLKQERHRSSTRKNYYSVSKVFNQFFIHLDIKPSTWEHRLTLFVGYLVINNRKSTTINCYVSAIKAVLANIGVVINENRFLLSALVNACKLRNDRISTKLPIRHGLTNLLLKAVSDIFTKQPYLERLQSNFCCSILRAIQNRGISSKSSCDENQQCAHQDQ